MSDSISIRKNWKLVLNIVTALALIILAYAIRGQLAVTLKYLTKVNSAALLLMIPLQAWNYHSQTKLTQSLFKALGNKIGYKPLYKTQLELNFVNTVFPTNGVSGASYFAARIKSKTITAGTASFVYIMKLAMTFFAFEFVLFIGLLFLAIGGNVNGFVILAATFSTTILIVSTMLVVYIVGSKTRIVGTLRTLSVWLNKLIQIFRRNNPETINLKKLEVVANEMHQNYRHFRNNYKELRGPLWYGFLNSLTEVLTIYVVYIAFGRWVNPGAVILAYALANFAGFISVLPSGVGMFEAIMTGVLVATGIPAAISLPVTIMYRVLNTLIQIPPGYYFYRKALKSGDKNAEPASG
jgi:uncharacterized protein (TIRG00374 family)